MGQMSHEHQDYRSLWKAPVKAYDIIAEVSYDLQG